MQKMEDSEGGLTDIEKRAMKDLAETSELSDSPSFAFKRFRLKFIGILVSVSHQHQKYAIKTINRSIERDFNHPCCPGHHAGSVFPDNRVESYNCSGILVPPDSGSNRVFA
jgi:hypothetical protein